MDYQSSSGDATNKSPALTAYELQAEGLRFVETFNKNFYKTLKKQFLSCGSGGLCEGKNQIDEAVDKKADEVKTKYPAVDCGSNPTPECKAYNDKMLALQNKEVAQFRDVVYKSVSETLTIDDKKRFEAITQVGCKMKAIHPEASNMTLKNINKYYPEDFKNVLSELDPQFPFIKNLTSDDILAMSPSLADETLDQIITDAKTLAGLSGLELTVGAGCLFIATLLAWLIFKRK